MSKQIEIERKYVIKKPSPEVMKMQSEYTESEITQVYLTSESGVTHRVRKRVFANGAVYTETKKIRIDRMSAVEEEREISEETYESLCEKIDEETQPVIKKRYTFFYSGVTFEIDVYPNWERTAIMETELENREVSVKMPSFIEIVREVTGERGYSNAAMARVFPPELI